MTGPPAPPEEPDPHFERPLFDPVGCQPTSESILTTLLQPACGGDCHGATDPAVGLDLVSMSPDTLAGRSSATCDGRALVVPGSPELSFLYDKVSAATPACGDPMPLEAALSVAGQACLADWIRSLAAGGCEKCGGEVCVALSSDAANCGSCGNACDVGLACLNGACVCAGGSVRCGDVCVDTLFDAANCGACGNVCPAGGSCRSGACVCPAPTIACGGACVDPNTNPSHCGACSNACPTGSACSSGQCDCSAPLVSCGSACTDMTSDPAHCGDCATSCATGDVCLLSACAAGCGSLTQCGSSCVDTDTSLLHCGACNAPCAAGLTCTGGRCECPTEGTTLCGTACVDTSSSPTNCGSCGRACGPTDMCVSGDCACDSTGAVAFSSVIAPKFETSCAGIGCHSGARPKEGLLLTAAAAYDELVGVSSGQCSGRKLVDPGSPSTSYLINKLLGTDMCTGTAMPKADMRLPQADIDAISAWICAGAPRN